jgi:hypothetical protein
MEAAKARHDSSACREIREHRFKGAIYRGVLVARVKTAAPWVTVPLLVPVALCTGRIRELRGIVTEGDSHDLARAWRK